jgi:hypothetical protein
LRTLAIPIPTSPVATLFSIEHIVEEAFAHFRRTGFPYRHVPVHVAMQTLNKLAATDASALLCSTVGYDVADSYHPHRFHATGGGKLSPRDAFERDDLLQRALCKELEQGKPIPAGFFGGLSIVSGVQPCSNFRPGVALHYYRRYCKKGATVLDTSTGYGGRLVGFLASGFAGRYIGIDPNRETHDGNRRLASDLGFGDAVELHCLPAEDVDSNIVRDRCDFALTSPPYFTKEHYSDEPTQSWQRYPTPDAWREGFLRPMLRLQFEALKRGAISVINIDDVTIKNKTHAVTEWTKTIAGEVGFELLNVERLSFPAAFWSTVQGVDTSEPVFIFTRALICDFVESIEREPSPCTCVANLMLLTMEDNVMWLLIAQLIIVTAPDGSRLQTLDAQESSRILAALDSISNRTHVVAPPATVIRDVPAPTERVVVVQPAPAAPAPPPRSPFGFNYGDPYGRWPQQIQVVGDVHVVRDK